MQSSYNKGAQKIKNTAHFLVLLIIGSHDKNSECRDRTNGILASCILMAHGSEKVA